MGWPNYVRDVTKAPGTAVALVFVLCGWAAPGYLLLVLATAWIRSRLGLGMLLVSTIALSVVNVRLYATSNSEWYLVVSPLILLGMSAVLLLLMGIPKAVMWISSDLHEIKARRTVAQETQPDDLSGVNRSLLGTCPNCRNVIRLTAEKCSRCDAMFGAGTTWKIEPLPH